MPGGLTGEELTNDNPGGLRTKPKLRRSASMNGLTRSNSVDNLGSTLKHSSRKRARPGNTKLTAEEIKEYSVIAVYSREAFENFGKTWRVLINENSDSLQAATKRSRKGVDPEDAKAMLGRQSKKVITTGFNDQVQSLLENKTIPHVIAVIEGKEEQNTLTLKTQIKEDFIDLTYSSVKFNQGLNTKGSRDEKQSMSFYVRNDMKHVYSFSDEKVKRGNSEIPAVGVNYQTSDGTKYKTLIVHIPNKFVGNKEKDQATHEAFEKFAKKATGGSSPVVVTSYLGDTNFKNPMVENSVASMGGIMSDGRTLSPQGSGAKRDTNFMQSVPLGEDQSGHSVLQPSTTNYVFIDTNDQNREATDHPSIISVIAHRFELVGRDATALPSYYQDWGPLPELP